MRAVNLLPPDLRSASAKGRGNQPAREPGEGIGAFILLGALALCVAAVAGLVLSSNVIKERTASLAQVTAKSNATVKHAADLKPYADFQEVALARVGTVQALANSRFDWEQSLRDLSKAMPRDVRLSSLTGDIGAAGAAASGASGIRGSISAPAIDLKGCTSSQPAVATMMARLRNIDGVTRVSLQKSEKPDTAPTDASGVGALCGKGDNPNFEVVVFFEGAAADVALAASATGEQPAAGTATASPAAKADGAAKAESSPGPSATTSPTTSTPSTTTSSTSTPQGGSTP